MALLSKLQSRRDAVGLTQQELAEVLNTSRRNVSNWETGLSNPTAGMLPLIADTLLCSIDHLYGREGETKCQ